MADFDKSTPIGFIGAGAVGGSLSVALKNAGYPVVAVASRTPASARAFAERLPGCAVLDDMQGVADCADFVFITTSDDAIAPVCESVRWREGRGLAHCSGAASVEPLASAASQGAAVGAFHPLQAFSSVEQGARNIPGTTFGIEAPPELRGYLETGIGKICCTIYDTLLNIFCLDYSFLSPTQKSSNTLDYKNII